MRSSGSVLLVCLFLLLALPPLARGTEEFARQTRQPCRTCHLDPAGGGELTATGRKFLASGFNPAVVTADHRPAAGPGTAGRLLRLVAGYIHLLTAILWFGTILYVHLVLKPTYAASGLPRGEVRVGLVSMAVMAVTGAVLVHYRVPDPALLFTTRFGILLTVKIALFAVMVVSALFVVVFIGPKLRGESASTPGAPPEGGEMSASALAQCDGREGRPAYVAYRGELYDVSGSRLWKEGNHLRRHQAGCDLTEALPLAPHGEEKVLAMPHAGRLAKDGAKPTRSRPEKVFYAMAYMNLTMVFLITLIVALWRWW